jgi:hypothetical protein
MNQKTKSSVGAFYNAEAGVEWALNKITSNSGILSTVLTPNDDGSVNCPDSLGADCKVFFLKKDGNVITKLEFASKNFNDIEAVRSVGLNDEGEVTHRAIARRLEGLT